MAAPRLLVLSGAGLPMWIWDKTLSGLEHQVVDFAALTGPDGSSGSGRAGSGGERLADYVATALDQAPWPTFTLVAHSVGGVVATELCRISPERVDGIIGVSAVIPAASRSFTGSMPIPQRFVLPLVLRFAGTRPPASAVRKGLASHLDDVVAQRIIDELRPESQGLFRDRVGSPVAFPDRRGYVVTTEDRELPLGLQSRFAAALEVPEPMRLEGGHLPMLERPEELRLALDDLLAS